jgi:hypothetical protein
MALRVMCISLSRAYLISIKRRTRARVQSLLCKPPIKDSPGYKPVISHTMILYEKRALSIIARNVSFHLALPHQTAEY